MRSYDDLTGYKLSRTPIPTQNIDYMCPADNINEYSLHQCWKQHNSVSVRSTKDDISKYTPSSASHRLENVCWRRWYKQMKNLPAVSPSCINWDKEDDVTWLYGPKFEEDGFGISCDASVPGDAPVPDDASITSDPGCGSRNGSIFSQSSDDSLRSIASESDISLACGYSRKGLLKTESKPKSKKTVKFNYIISSREIVSGIPFDYGYMDKFYL